MALTHPRSRYLEDLLALGAQPLSTMRVLELAEDPNASTAELARVVEADPTLTVQVLRLANSAGYGMAGSVGSANRAVALLGFTTVRALAVTAVCELLDDADRHEPGYWSHSAACGIACSVVARRAGISPHVAFTAGMLHDLGSAVLHVHHGNAYRTVRELAGSSATRLLEGEREAFSATHVDVGAELLTSLRVPNALVAAVSQHHRPPGEVTGTLAKVVVAGIALGQMYEHGATYDPGADLTEALGVLGLAAASPKTLLAEVNADARAMSGALGLAEQ